MNKFIALLFVLALFANIAFSCEGHPEHDHGDEDHHDHDESFVNDLTTDTFQNSIAEHDVSLVMFFAPWCGHCKTLKPLYEEAAKQLSANKKIALSKVDCTKNDELCKVHKVQGYPTLIIFKNGKAEAYEGDRTTKSIIQTLEDELRPPVSVLESNEEIEEFKKQHPIGVVGFFDNDHDDRYKLFNELAGTTMKKNAKFAVVIDKDFSKEHVESTPNVVLFRKFDEPKVAHKGEFDSESLTKFITGNVIPLLGEINRESYKKYEAITVPLAYLFINSENDNTQTLKDVKKIAEAQKGKAVFCWVDMKKFPQQATHMGLSGKVLPALSVDSLMNKARYNFDESSTFSFETVSQWMDDVVAGKVAPFVKSQPEPEQTGPVVVAVGTTFKKLVLDSPKDVLVEFYAPWCGHCKNLAPIYDKLGEYLKDVESVSIVKIDADSNDVPSDIEIRGYPTIMLFKADDKENPISYEGQRNDHMDFVEFIQDNASIDFKLPSKDVDEEEVETKESSKSAKHDEL